MWPKSENRLRTHVGHDDDYIYYQWIIYFQWIITHIVRKEVKLRSVYHKHGQLRLPQLVTFVSGACNAYHLSVIAKLMRSISVSIKSSAKSLVINIAIYEAQNTLKLGFPLMYTETGCQNQLRFFRCKGTIHKTVNTIFDIYRTWYTIIKLGLKW